MLSLCPQGVCLFNLQWDPRPWDWWWWVRGQVPLGRMDCVRSWPEWHALLLNAFLQLFKDIPLKQVSGGDGLCFYVVTEDWEKGFWYLNDAGVPGKERKALGYRCWYHSAFISLLRKKMCGVLRYVVCQKHCKGGWGLWGNMVGAELSALPAMAPGCLQQEHCWDQNTNPERHRTARPGWWAGHNC